MITVKPIERIQLERLIARGEVIERDAHGIKVVRLADGRFLKCFRRKRFFNRDLLAPAAVRFARRAHQLHKLGVPTLQVVGLHRVLDGAHTIAVYEPLPGQTLRDLLARGQMDGDRMYRVGVFIARLHRLGIYFRSVHPGNIVLDGPRPGLIDILDMRFRPWSLTRWERRRNWLHFLRREEDRPHLKPELVDELLMGYGDAADLSPRASWAQAERIRTLLAR